MKTKSDHTPGPWKWDTVRLCGEFGQVVAITPQQPYRADDEEEASANERLISSAPELLAACRNAVNVLAGLIQGDLKEIRGDSPALLQLRAAISKAEGRTK
jgi:hypothetical protein